MSKKKFLSTLLLLSFALSSLAFAHCQIPCGIYGDEARFYMMREHLQTIEKSMVKIQELSEDITKEPALLVNQEVRWVNNKEQHADEFSKIITQYFLAQRIKPDTPNYHQKLALLHQMQVLAMKCKQNPDPIQVQECRMLLDKFQVLYTGKPVSHRHQCHEGEA